MWSPEGIITKILIRKGAPKTGFWLAQNQLGYVEDDDALEVWDGELSDPELSSNSDGEDNEDDDDMYFSGTNKLSDESRADNLLEKEGVQLKLSVMTNNAEKVDASEYNPGGFVILKIQVIDFSVCLFSKSSSFFQRVFFTLSSRPLFLLIKKTLGLIYFLQDRVKKSEYFN